MLHNNQKKAMRKRITLQKTLAQVVKYIYIFNKTENIIKRYAF